MFLGKYEAARLPVSELKVRLPDVVSLQCRQPSLTGIGEISRGCFRRGIIDGEVRQKQAWTC